MDCAALEWRIREGLREHEEAIPDQNRKARTHSATTCPQKQRAAPHLEDGRIHPA